MIYWRNNHISDKQEQILIYIYKYRALTNEYLRKLIFGHLKSNPDGQKANISRYVSGLRKMKMIGSESCYPVSKELIHYLTKKGVDFVKEHVCIGVEGDLFAGFDGEPYGDFDAAILKPGLRNKVHIKMHLDFVIKCRNILNVRHNLYAVQDFVYYQEQSGSGTYKAGKIRPDGEIRVNSGHLFSLEIDTGSERYEQLVAKFLNYRRYLDYCAEHNQKEAWAGILFVCKDSELPIEKDIRVQTVIRAAIEGLQYHCWTFTLQIYRSQNIVLKKMMEKNKKFFEELSIAVPSKVNPAKVEMQRREREEIERERKREIAQLQVQQQIARERQEYEQRQRQEAERRKREIEEDKKKNRFFGMGKFLP